MMILLMFLVLLTLSSLFSASETAFFSIDRLARARLREQKTTAAERVLALLKKPRDLLVAILFGNVLINIFYFSVANSLASQVRDSKPWLEPAIHLGSLVAIILFGEIAPKTLTLGAPVATAQLLAPILKIWQRMSRFITEPLSWLTERTLGVVERRWPPPGPLSEVELAQAVALQGREGTLSANLSSLMEDVLLLSRVRVREIMTPRVDIRSFDLSEGREAFLKLVAQVRRMKIPVHKGDGLDGLTGVLNVKEVLRAPGVALTALVKPAWFIPETKSVESLLQDMLVRDATLAIVVDEYGGTAGLVTVEDVIEEVVGDISSQPRPSPLEAQGEGVYLVLGLMSVRELNEQLGLNLDDGATTVAGWFARSLGRIPKVGDEIEIERGWLKVVKMDKFRTRRVELRLKSGVEEAS